MAKFSLDYSGLANQFTKKAYRLSDVKDQLETVAFDVVRFKDADKGAELWQIQNADDGDYIVAMYQDDEETEKTSSNWSVLVTKTAGDLQVIYKGDPLVKVAYDKLGIPRSELYKIEQYLPEKLASNKKLVKALLNELTESTRLQVFKKYPELV